MNLVISLRNGSFQYIYWLCWNPIPIIIYCIDNIFASL